MGLSLRFWIFAVTLLVALSSLGVVAGLYIANLGSPVEILEQEDVGHIVQNDGRLWIHFKINRTRTCLADNSHFLMSDISVNGRTEPVVIPILQDGPVPFEGLGESYFTLSVPLPNGVFPVPRNGTPWKFITKRVDQCGLFGLIFPHRSESAPLTINIEQIRAAPGVPVTSQAKPGGPKTIISNSPITPPARP